MTILHDAIRVINDRKRAAGLEDGDLAVDAHIKEHSGILAGTGLALTDLEDAGLAVAQEALSRFAAELRAGNDNVDTMLELLGGLWVDGIVTGVTVRDLEARA